MLMLALAGLVASAPSWAAPDYGVAYAGSCWELYGNTRASDYPPYMHYPGLQNLGAKK